MKYKTMLKSLEEIKNQCEFESVPSYLRELHGGDINKVYLIEERNTKWIVKENEAEKYPSMLEKEYRALLYLHEKSTVYYPRPHKAFEFKGRQFLVMEYVNMGIASTLAERNFGTALALQHKITNNQFGWMEDNYIGSLPQVNTFTDKWNDFFAEYRLLNQAKRAFDAGLFDKTDIRKVETLCSRLDVIIPEESPALLHGDLWSGNYFIDHEGQAVLYDPAVYFGHREMDLAMTLLFGGFSPHFYREYARAYPIDNEFDERLPFFQLYPNMVHLNLFGEIYLNGIRSVLRLF